MIKFRMMNVKVICWFCREELESNNHYCVGKKKWINSLKESGKIIYPKTKFKI